MSETKPKKYRFFYHYFKSAGKMSIHFRNVCQVVDNVICRARCETHWQSRQPRLVMRGHASMVTHITEPDGTVTAVIWP